MGKAAGLTLRDGLNAPLGKSRTTRRRAAFGVDLAGVRRHDEGASRV